MDAPDRLNHEGAQTTVHAPNIGVRTNGRSVPARAAVDLHLHTFASDGFWTPEALINYLAERSFRVGAICDHDTQRSVVEAIDRGAERGIVILPGVEVTTNWRDRQWHILVYGIRPDRTDNAAQPFLDLMRELDEQLQLRAEDARQRIEASGRPLPSLEEVRAGRPLWPFHVLSSAIQEKHVPGLKEAAELVVELGGTFTADLPLADVVAAAHQAGGICLIAHPGRADAVGIMTENDLDQMLAEGIAIDGLEAHYRSFTDAQTELYRSMAATRGMLVSCGSDSHAPGKPVDPRPWQAIWCAKLLGRLGVHVEEPTDDLPVWAPGMDPLATVPEPEKRDEPGEGGGETPEEQMVDAQTEPAGVASAR
jgi:3',5'-nucleoside bisphosphate phosphatase